MPSGLTGVLGRRDGRSRWHHCSPSARNKGIVESRAPFLINAWPVSCAMFGAANSKERSQRDASRNSTPSDFAGSGGSSAGWSRWRNCFLSAKSMGIAECPPSTQIAAWQGSSAKFENSGGTEGSRRSSARNSMPSDSITCRRGGIGRREWPGCAPFATNTVIAGSGAPIPIDTWLISLPKSEAVNGTENSQRTSSRNSMPLAWTGVR